MIYLALLLIIASIGGVSAVGLRIAKTTQQRASEAELLVIGLAFRRAMSSYADATPNGMPNTETLSELLRDPTLSRDSSTPAQAFSRPADGQARLGNNSRT